MSCDELQTLPRPVPLSVNYNRFMGLAKDNKKVLNDWFELAWKMREAPPEEHYQAFLLTWELLGFVAEIITGSRDMDAWYPVLVNDTMVSGIFGGVVENKKSLLRMYTKRFALSWPIFPVHVVNQYSIGKEFSPIRSDRVVEYISQGMAGFAPPCWQNHWTDPEFVPDWAHTLSAWYLVRKNLLDAEGYTHSETDVRIVSNAFLSLIYFFKEGKLFFENPSLKPDIFDRTQVLSSL